MKSSYLYTDKEFMPVPKYKEGQVVYVIENTFQPHVAQKLIRMVQKPHWVEYEYSPQDSHWAVRYRYQDMHNGKTEGRMHSEYTLEEEMIYPTEEEATIVLAEEFLTKVQQEAKTIMRRFKALGITPNDSLRLLDK